MANPSVAEKLHGAASRIGRPVKRRMSVFSIAARRNLSRELLLFGR